MAVFDGYEILVGTYEEYLMSYKLVPQIKSSNHYDLVQSFTVKAHVGPVRCVTSGTGCETNFFGTFWIMKVDWKLDLALSLYLFKFCTQSQLFNDQSQIDGKFDNQWESFAVLYDFIGFEYTTIDEQIKLQAWHLVLWRTQNYEATLGPVVLKVAT